DFSHDRWLYLLFTCGLPGVLTTAASFFSLFRIASRAVIKSLRNVEMDASLSTMLVGVLCVFADFLLASFTQHPFGLLLWDTVLGALLGIGCSACEYIGADMPDHALASAVVVRY